MSDSNNNRNLKHLGFTILGGILIIGGLMASEIMDVPSPEIVNQATNSNVKDIDVKIDAIKNDTFSPGILSTISSEIASSFDSNLLTGSQKSYLENKLVDEYSKKLYSQCDFFLMNDSGDSKEIMGWLSELETKTTKTADIDKYKDQITQYVYYSETLPQKVTALIEAGTDYYSDEEYVKYVEEVKTMPELDPAYKNKPKFTELGAKMLLELNQYNSDYYTAAAERQTYNNINDL